MFAFLVRDFPTSRTSDIISFKFDIHEFIDVLFIS
jgi:hypothetical protein